MAGYQKYKVLFINIWYDAQYGNKEILFYVGLYIGFRTGSYPRIATKSSYAKMFLTMACILFLSEKLE